MVPIYVSGQSGTALFQLRGIIRAEQGTAADAFQRPLRFRFQARLSAGVRLQMDEEKTTRALGSLAVEIYILYEQVSGKVL